LTIWVVPRHFLVVILMFAVIFFNGLNSSDLSQIRERNGWPSSIACYLGRSWRGLSWAERVRDPHGPVTFAIAWLVRICSEPQLRLRYEAFFLTFSLLLAISQAAGAYAAHAPHSEARTSGSTQMITIPTPTSSPSGPTYDEVCGPDPIEPGTGAPDWAGPALHSLWLGANGTGALVAGCADTAHPFRAIPT
jgi:hypothetical protein